MDKWEMVRLGDYVNQIRGVSYKPEDAIESADDNHVPILRAHNIQVTGLNANNLVFVDKKKIKPSQYIQKGDIVVCASSGSKDLVGKAAQAKTDMPASFGAFCKVVRPKHEIEPSFLNHFFTSSSYRKRISDLSAGANINNLRNEHIDDLEIPLPPLPVQQQIADVLDRTSALIEKRKAQIEKLDLLVKSQFIEMFGDANQMDKWACVSIGCVATVSVGVVIKPAQYYTDKSDGIKAFRSLNIGEMRIKADNWVYFTPEGHAKNSKSVLMADDVLIVRSGAPGTACLVTKEYEGSNAIDVIIARPDKDIVNPVYLCAFTNNPHGKRQIEQGTGGAAQQHFNVGRYKDMTIALPPMVSQNQFAAFVGQVESQKSLLQQSLEKLELNYKSLMQKCFRGEMF